MWETRHPSAPILCCFYIPGCCVLGRLLNFPEPASAPRPMDKYLCSTSLGTRNDEFKLCFDMSPAHVEAQLCLMGVLTGSLFSAQR